MSDHTIVIICVVKIFFVQFFFVFYHLFLISSASVMSLPFLSFIVPIFAWNVPLVSLIFLTRSLVFPFYCFPLFLCIDRWGRLSYLTLLFFATLHSDAYIFPFSFAFCFSPFLEEISRLSHSIVFLYFFALITAEGFLISPCYLLEPCIQMGISFLFSFAFRFSSIHSYLFCFKFIYLF